MSDLSINNLSSSFIGLDPEKKPVDSVNNSNEIIAQSVITEENKAVNGEAKPQDESQSSVAEVEAAVEEMNAFVQSMQRNLSFSIDEQLGEKIISVKDVESEEVIRQIPSEELVVLRKKMDDVVGILFDTKV